MQAVGVVSEELLAELAEELGLERILDDVEEFYRRKGLPLASQRPAITPVFSVPTNHGAYFQSFWYETPGILLNIASLGRRSKVYDLRKIGEANATLEDAFEAMKNSSDAQRAYQRRELRNVLAHEYFHAIFSDKNPVSKRIAKVTQDWMRQKDLNAKEFEKSWGSNWQEYSEYLRDKTGNPDFYDNWSGIYALDEIGAYTASTEFEDIGTGRTKKILGAYRGISEDLITKAHRQYYFAISRLHKDALANAPERLVKAITKGTTPEQYVQLLAGR